MKKIAFIIVLAAILGFAYSASAESYQERDARWHECARVEVGKFLDRDKNVVDTELCKGVLNMEAGPACDEQAAVLGQLGMLEQLLNDFLYTNVVVPKCGGHPEE